MIVRRGFGLGSRLEGRARRSSGAYVGDMARSKGPGEPRNDSSRSTTTDDGTRRENSADCLSINLYDPANPVPQEGYGIGA